LPPATSSGLGVALVSGRMRSPRPAAKISAFMTLSEACGSRATGVWRAGASGLRATEAFGVQGKLAQPLATRSTMSEQNPRLQPVLLPGGSGTRLWPLSREAYPKQFLALAGERTMLQDTWQRVAELADGAVPIVVANEEHRFLAAEQ